VEELHRIAEDFKRLKIDVLGISGGDGTNHVTLTGFINVYEGASLPQIAFLRGGTMNTVANSVGVSRGRPEGLLDRLIHAYAERASRPLGGVERRVMRVGDHFGFLFGTGVVYGFLAEYYRDGEPTPLVAAKTLFRGVGSTLVRGEMVRRMAEPFRGKVVLDDGTTWEERDYLSVAAGTIDQIGLNFKPFYRYAERDEGFHILGVKASPFGFVTQLPRIHRALPMQPHLTEDGVATRAVVSAARGSRMRYMIDGDLHEGGSDLEVTVGPRVRIVVGT
ncbi:MAG: sphingosine kinase, partial [Myxococcales bacterium]|nr:sphingosine kinase [Myxococcales bacterium]